MTHTCNPSYLAEIGRITVRSQPGQIRPHLQNKQRKMDWKCDSSSLICDHLLCKHEALSSNPSSTKITIMITIV
jgi:hypothetical protein